MDTKEQPQRILVVDDDEDIQLVTGMVLRKLGSQLGPIVPERAFSASEAIIRLTPHPPHIDLVLLDIVMETQDAGYLVIEHIDSLPEKHRPKVIIRSGQAELRVEPLPSLPNFVIGLHSKTDLDAGELGQLVLKALEAPQSS
mgnify:CR=1 FL=1